MIVFNLIIIFNIIPCISKAIDISKPNLKALHYLITIIKWVELQRNKIYYFMLKKGQKEIERET